MSLIKCKECGCDVSSKASKCPSCGAGYWSTFGFRLRDGFSIAIILAVFLMVVTERTGLNPIQLLQLAQEGRAMERQHQITDECTRRESRQGKSVDQIFEDCLPKVNQ